MTPGRPCLSLLKREWGGIGKVYGGTCKRYVLSFYLTTLMSGFNFVKAEAFSPPNKAQADKGAQFVGSYHGFNGPVQVTYPEDMYGGPQQGAFIDTIFSLIGINRSKDLNGGQPNCVSITPLSMNWHDGDHRSSSVQAYLTPVESVRTGWTTLISHTVFLR